MGGSSSNPPRALGRRLLQRAVLEELLPVDILYALVLRTLVDVGDRKFFVPRAPENPAAEVRGLRLDVPVLALGSGTGVHLLVGEHRVCVELLANLVYELEAR